MFPDLRDASWGHLNLNHVARDWLLDRGHGLHAEDPNPLLDPACCAAMVAAAHDRRRLDASYGGWLENRRDLWHGSYLERQSAWIHLGVDFNVPAGSRVVSPHHARVLRVESDVPEEGGWGTRIILQARGIDGLLIYAHFEPSPRVVAGDIVVPGETLGRVGEPPDNGGWFPHLHVQRFTPIFVGAAPSDLVQLDALRELDGYGHENELSRWARLCPDPLRLVNPF